MNRCPEIPRTSLKVYVAVALSAIALNAAEAQPVMAKTADAMAGNQQKTETEARIIGNFAVSQGQGDKYSTKNLPVILKRIGGCESKGKPSAKIYYKAQNPSSTASGGFQFLDSTWNNYRGYKKAKYAPHRVQNRKAILTYKKYGTSPWAASRPCWD